jgi:hypothetical protein
MSYSKWGYSRYESMNTYQSKSISDTILKKQYNIPTLSNISNIKPLLDSKLETGELSVMTEDNFPFRHFLYKEDIERKFKIAALCDNIDIIIANNYHITINGKEYQCEEYITPIIVEQNDSNPYLSDESIKNLLKYCEEEGISHIYNIGQYREGITFDYIESDIISMDTPIDISEYVAYQFDINKKPTYEGINMHIQNDDMGMTGILDDDTDSPMLTTEPFKFGYVFNKSYYTIIGLKCFTKDAILEWQKCTNSMDYFYKNYINKK